MKHPDIVLLVFLMVTLVTIKYLWPKKICLNVADFIVEHRINGDHDLEVGYITCTPWKLYFDGSVCDDERGVGIGNVLISPSGAVFELSNRLEEFYTNNQVEYEALLFGLEFLESMGIKHVEAYVDSLLVVQQVSKVC